MLILVLHCIYICRLQYLIVLAPTTVVFSNNTASLYGGAIYVDYPIEFEFCPFYVCGSVENAICFVNNSASISGNDMYFKIPRSCSFKKISRIQNDFCAPNILNCNYTQPLGTVAASPYKVYLCSRSSCDLNKDSCFIDGPNMLGHPIYFNATVCDYFNKVSGEAVHFEISCINCYPAYRLLNSQLLLHHNEETISIVGLNASDDGITDYVSLNLTLASLLPSEFKQLTATLSFNLSTSFSGFVLSKYSQTCECYNDDDVDVIQCNGTNAEIRQGYWFGIVLLKCTVSLCPNLYYCDFRTETRNGYYSLPRTFDDQCRSHKTGVACGDCI